MNGKVFGVPLILILLVLFIALAVDVPVFFMMQSQRADIKRIKIVPVVTEKIVIVTPTPEPVFIKGGRTATPAGQIK